MKSENWCRTLERKGNVGQLLVGLAGWSAGQLIGRSVSLLVSRSAGQSESFVFLLVDVSVVIIS